MNQFLLSPNIQWPTATMISWQYYQGTTHLIHNSIRLTSILTKTMGSFMTWFNTSWHKATYAQECKCHQSGDHNGGDCSLGGCNNQSHGNNMWNMFPILSLLMGLSLFIEFGLHIVANDKILWYFSCSQYWLPWRCSWCWIQSIQLVMINGINNGIAGPVSNTSS